MLSVVHVTAEFSLSERGVNESFRVKRSSGRAGTVSDLLQTSQIGVGPRMNFPKIGTNETEWLYKCWTLTGVTSWPAINLLYTNFSESVVF